MARTSARSTAYFLELIAYGDPGSNWSLLRRGNGRALPWPARIAGRVTGGVSWKTPG
jgi:hypothetical protein